MPPEIDMPCDSRALPNHIWSTLSHTLYYHPWSLKMETSQPPFLLSANTHFPLIWISHVALQTEWCRTQEARPFSSALLLKAQKRLNCREATAGHSRTGLQLVPFRLTTYNHTKYGSRNSKGLARPALIEAALPRLMGSAIQWRCPPCTDRAPGRPYS